MSGFLARVAGAPITWGVDGSPGWGHIMDRDRVLSEMATTGLVATELGPDGWLPTEWLGRTGSNSRAEPLTGTAVSSEVTRHNLDRLRNPSRSFGSRLFT